MRSVPYSKVEKGVAAIAGIDPSNLLEHEKVMISEYVSDASKYVWDYYPWPESTVTEIRYFRPNWEESETYYVGDEVFYEGRYWRKWADETSTRWQTQISEYNAQNERWSEGSEPVDNFVWFEIGDFDINPEWAEMGVYYVGAKVEYKGSTYLCIKQNSDDGNGRGINYVLDQIDPRNSSYWMKIETKFERFISYEQAGKTIIGTMIAAHLEDPRYEESTPLNWVEGAEGIYIETPEETNFVWIRFRKEAPEYTEDSPTDPVLNFLTPAIKAYAYRSFLISDGQHEKATLQDSHALDLLVREVDKLNHQQDRGQTGTIYSEPYRRVTVKGTVHTEPADQQIATLFHRGVDTDITISVKKKVTFNVYKLKSSTSTSEAKLFTVYANIIGRIQGAYIFEKTVSTGFSFSASSSSSKTFQKNVSSTVNLSATAIATKIFQKNTSINFQFFNNQTISEYKIFRTFWNRTQPNWEAKSHNWEDIE